MVLPGDLISLLFKLQSHMKLIGFTPYINHDSHC